jgi:choice-of-anchor B domain-containing protein
VVDITDAEDPLVMFFVPTQTVASNWRDIKVFKNHMYIISEASNHGMQIVDLTVVRDPQVRAAAVAAKDAGEQPPRREPDVHYDEFGNCHNIALNEDTGMAYAIGSRTCRGGPHIIEINHDEPLKVEYAGCDADDGYTHDNECVTYKGPDAKYRGRSICFNYNENSLTIVDVTDPQNVKQLSRTSYTGVQYTHQGWLTEDQTHLLMDDELDEMYGSVKFQRTLIWNVEDLENPKHFGDYDSGLTVADHNLYIVGNEAFCANYQAGLRVLDITNIRNADLKETHFFDVYPEGNQVAFNGAWSVYPWFPSGNIVVQSIERGLFVLHKSDAAVAGN